MKREWKPGDVAIIEGKVALYVDGPNVPRKRGPFWQWGNGGWTTLPLGPQHLLVVIDPEDREQVERLAREYVETWTVNPGNPAPETVAIAARQMQAALREFANPTPPKPEEPTGLGAVVEDAEGNVYVRQCSRGAEFDMARPWLHIATRRAPMPAHRAEHSYADISAVRVLSEGIQ